MGSRQYAISACKPRSTSLTVLWSCRHASTCEPFKPVTGPHAWYRSQYEDVDSYSYQFSAADIAELAKAVADVRAKGLELKVYLLLLLLIRKLCVQMHSSTHVLRSKFGSMQLSATWQASQAYCSVQDVKKSDFVLPKLGPKLVEFRDEAVNGRGFVLLRGLPVQDWPVEDVAIAYWGLGAYWGKAQPQNRLHHLLGHVKVR